MKYMLIKVKLKGLETMEQYNEAVYKSPVEYYKTLKEIFNKYGKLKRVRCGYHGSNGLYDYIVYKM